MPANERKQPADQESKGEFPSRAHQFPPGVSGNPAGRKAAGASVRDWWNIMEDWTLAKIAEVLTDPTSPAAKVAAARTWIDASSTDRNAAGSPIAGAEIDRICDRTDGKPTQRIEQTIDTPLAIRIITPMTEQDNDTPATNL